MTRTPGLFWRLRYPLAGVALVFITGFVGYLVLGNDAVEAFTKTVLVLTTVGFSEPLPADAASKLFTDVIALAGVSIYLALLAAAAAVLAEGRVLAVARVRRVERRIARLRDHVVVCAYGRVGRAAAARLRSEGATYVVVDRKEELDVVMRAAGEIALTADPSSEDTLERLGIRRARALVTCVDSDADNVFITLTARALNPGLFIVARASESAAAGRLYRAGADRVVSPYVASGRQMAMLATRPRMLDYVELPVGDDAEPLRIEELLVEDDSPMSGRTVREASGGAIALALQRRDGEVTAPPSGDEVLRAGDVLVVLGDPGELRAAEGTA